MSKLIRKAFYVSLLLFLVMGAVLVLAQLGGVAGFQPQLVVDLKKILGPPTFMMSTLCALLAFALTYTREDKPASSEDDAAEEPTQYS